MNISTYVTVVDFTSFKFDYRMVPHVSYHKCHISMTFFRSYVGMELMCIYHHICDSCRASLLSSVMIEWSLV